MKTQLILVCVSALILASCSSTGDKGPRYADSVQMVAYDTVSGRKINPNFQIYERESDVKRPFKVIAMLSRNAKPSDGAKMITAIAWRAQHLGADAMIILPPESTGWEFNAIGRYASFGQGEPIYRAHAIIFEAPTPSN